MNLQKKKKTHNVEIVNFHGFLMPASSSETLQIIPGINLHGTFLNFSIDAHAIVNIVDLPREPSQ